MSKGNPLYVRILATRRYKPIIEKDALDPKAWFKIEKYKKLDTWMYFDQKKAEETYCIHEFHVTFRSAYAARKYAEKYGYKLHKSYWAGKLGFETAYIIWIGEEGIR